jgi:hypothetical protein
VNLDDRLDCLLAAYSFDFIPRFEIHCYWVSRGGYGLVELFLLSLLVREARTRERGTNDLREGGFQPIPLRLILPPPFGFCQRIGKCCVVGPELEFFEGWFACK